MHMNTTWLTFFLLLFAVLMTCYAILHWTKTHGRKLDKQALRLEIAELEARVQFMNFLNIVRRVEIDTLTERIMSILQDGNVTGSELSAIQRTENNDPALQSIQNISDNAFEVQPSLSLYRDKPSLQLPSMYHFLPHFLDHPSGLQPLIWLSGGRGGASIVLGVRSFRREKDSLIPTLHNMIENMSRKEADDTLIIVFIGEIDDKYVRGVCEKLEKEFDSHVKSGLLEVISPRATYYPNNNYFAPPVKDEHSRNRESKENLDLAFLMMYAQERGSFYVQLQDDILTTPNYVRDIKKYAFLKSKKKSPWFTINFSHMGVFGKLYKSIDLPWLIKFFLMFHEYKPANWLLNHIVYAKLCRKDEAKKTCDKKKNALMLHFYRHLFQWNNDNVTKGIKYTLQGKNFSSQSSTRGMRGH